MMVLLSISQLSERLGRLRQSRRISPDKVPGTFDKRVYLLPPGTISPASRRYSVVRWEVTDRYLVQHVGLELLGQGLWYVGWVGCQRSRAP